MSNINRLHYHRQLIPLSVVIKLFIKGRKKRGREKRGREKETPIE